MHPTEQKIWEHFRIKRGDVLPYTGWSGTRKDLPLVWKELGYKRGVEVGVRNGAFSKHILETMPGVELYSIDPWRAFARNSDEGMEKSYQTCKTLLEPLGGILVRKTSLEAVKHFENNSLDFVYIDGLHEFNPFMLDLIWWSQKVKIGGMVAGHDYFQFYQSGVVRAVDAFTIGNGINPWYVIRHDPEPSFFWIKWKESLGMAWV